MEPPGDRELGRLRWRCRRGMKELDLVLCAYLRDRWAGADPRERSAFERILELPDPQLTAYLMQRDAPADTDMQSLLELLRGEGAVGQPAASSAPAPLRPVQS